ncbi:MAG TPA: hypothetical protein OIM61_03155 [Clostridiaceae bacterium]|jgi:hypothetical protein|nr:hypothetical protein [Clostridia bacterium]HJJ18253.1 hypothetical protein [Clostridiaceae bacterium]
MKRKIAFLFCVIIIVFCKENYAKYIVEQTILIAEINIDTIFPEIELISITETPEKEQYKVNFQIKVVENNIKINKFNKENIVARIGEKKIENEEYELNKVYEGEKFILYEIKLKRNTIKRKSKNNNTRRNNTRYFK